MVSWAGPLFWYAPPCLDEQRRNNQCSRVFQMAFQSGGQFVEFHFADQFFVQHAQARILDEFEQQHTTPMTRRINMNQSVHADIDQPRFSLSMCGHTDPPIVAAY